MTGSTISRVELDRRIALAGHRAWEGQPELTAGHVNPPRDAYITVGANLDSTLKNEFREYYFCCLLISRENPVPGVRDDPRFALAGHFPAIEADQPSIGEFAQGPFRWLLRRLLRFDGLLVWPESRDESGTTQGFYQNLFLGDLPRLRQRLPADPGELASQGAVALDLKEPEDCRILWEVANSIASSFDNWYVSDPDCLEVYLLHHHDKVVVAIPDEARRAALLDELDESADLIEDYSGYGSDWDDDDDEPN